MNALAANPDITLPSLRQDLQLFRGAPTLTGQATWLIYDPVRHRYFQLTRRAVGLLQCWDEVPLAEFCARATDETSRDITDDEVRQLIQFLFANNLTQSPPDGDPRAYAAQVSGNRRSPLLRAVHGYLFFRIPLLRPEAFLRRTLSFIAPLMTRSCALVVVAASLVGLYLASRQWDAFRATIDGLISLEGLALYGAALVFVKMLHELGHAYAATRFGVRVNTMGVAFMVMMPLLYTDVSDAWRLRSRRRKLLIDAAGVIVELSLAGLATFVWVFLPDGPLRSAVFVVATTSWVLSLLVNANPFMRFDGYYLLADAWVIPNLQPRAFALTRWQIREWLFSLGVAPPETLARRTHWGLVAYAIATWVYRLGLFIAIALIVYGLFFKALGVVLFVIEIAWFIVLPVWREIIEWWKLRDEIMATQRTWVSIAVLAALVVLVAVPWRSTIVIPATTAATAEMRLFPSRPARLSKLNAGDGVAIAEDEVVAVLTDDDLDFEIAQAARAIRLLDARLARIAGDSRELSLRAVLITEREAATEKHAGLLAERARLTIRAPFAGTVRDVMVDLHPGRSLKQTDALLRLVSGSGNRARGYVSEEVLSRIVPGSSGRFIPDDPALPARTVQLAEMSLSGAAEIDIPYLASVYGGPVHSEAAPDGRLRPKGGHHLVEFDMSSASERRVTRGVVHLAGKPESFAATAWRRVLKVRVRESGL